MAAFALVLCGCSGSSTVGIGRPVPASTAAAAPPPSQPSLSDKIESFFSKPPKEAKPAGATQAAQQSNIECPLIDIRQGAATLTIPPPPPDGSNEAMSLKYQGVFVRAARDCKLVANQVTMRLGVEGRIIVGPAGGPGQVDVPLRVAVVDQDAARGSKLIVTKLIRVPVTVAPGEGSVSFTHVEDDLSFPMPPGRGLDRYLIYIGFDPIGAQEQDRSKGKPAPKVRSKPKANTPTG